MNQREPSPKIVSLSWGRIEVQRLGVHNDVKLYPGGGRDWDWTETGNRHVPASSQPTWRNSRTRRDHRRPVAAWINSHTSIPPR